MYTSKYRSRIKLTDSQCIDGHGVNQKLYIVVDFTRQLNFLSVYNTILNYNIEYVMYMYILYIIY